MDQVLTAIVETEESIYILRLPYIRRNTIIKNSKFDSTKEIKNHDI